MRFSWLRTTWKLMSISLVSVLVITMLPTTGANAASTSEVWLTDMAQGSKLSKKPDTTFIVDDGAPGLAIVVDEYTPISRWMALVPR